MNDAQKKAFAEDFLKQVSGHHLTVIRDDGLYRHLRFKRPGSYCMFFDIVTWPGFLCYSGDMGCFVFSRLDDMFEFFRRRPNDPQFRIDYRYWAEKVQAQDKSDGITEFSADTFKAEVKDYFDQATDDADVWTPAAKAELWEAIKDSVFVSGLDDDGEHGAWVALRAFNHPMPKGPDGNRIGGRHAEFWFTDWERQCREYSHRFVWCCHALEWAIDLYDATKSPARAEGAPA